MANERIWRLDDKGAPTPLAEEAYANEDALQELVADHPDVLEGITPDEPRRLLLVRREMGVREDAESADRWSVDHLLVDQDACPTLVEVKRRANPEIRRRIVGQMLDYAAHARYWNLDAVRDHFEETARDDARERVAKIIKGDESDEDAYEEFWERFGENVQAERIRLLFVADDIPDDLATVVRFLSRHMAPGVEVMAVEIKQFRSGSARTLVPRVVAGLERPVSRAGGPRTKQTRESLLAALPESAARAAAELMDRAAAANATLYFGSSGASIRARSPAWPYLATVAWIFPPGGGAGWMRTRDFSFGASDLNGYDPEVPLGLVNVLKGYAEQFALDDWATDVSSKGVNAYAVGPENVEEHIDTLAGRVEAVLRELANLPPAEG